jgi:hypothetical protein
MELLVARGVVKDFFPITRWARERKILVAAAFD